jgi:excinuclease ABC subunit C
MLNYQKIIKKIPNAPGVYIMKDKGGNILYIGKASNLKKRVSSYFSKPQNLKVKELIKQVEKIDFKKTKSSIEALILEAALIKKYQSPFNVKEKDDKSFLFLEITNETFPRVILVRGKDKINGERYGPFTSASQIREALKIIRKIFPFNTHPPKEIGIGKPCFNYQIGLCPGTCLGIISPSKYQKTIENLKLLLQGNKEKVIKKLEKEMKKASNELNFELANERKKQISSLKYLKDIYLTLKEENSNLNTNNTKIRIEGYDISNISGKEAVGSMVVFINNLPFKKGYRIFKIKFTKQINDIAMLKEVIQRRLKHKEWDMPNLILIDGGKGHLNTIKKLLHKLKIQIPVLAIAKGEKRKNNKILGEIPDFVDKKILIKIRDEAHRFALYHHRKLRNKNFLEIK